MNDKRKENEAAPRVVKATVARGRSVDVPTGEKIRNRQRLPAVSRV
jgi:hypothetical protein